MASRTAQDLNRLLPDDWAEGNVENLARLIADGYVPFPVDSDSKASRSLLDEVGRLRRQKLLHLVARAIAADLLITEKVKGPPC